MVKLRLFVLTLAVLMVSDIARGDFIVTLSAGAGLDGLGVNPTPPGFNGKMTAYSFQGANRIVTNGINGPINSGAQTNNYTGPGASNPNFVNIDLDVFAMNAPMDISFVVQPQTSLPGGQPIGNAEYFFTVTMRNRLNDNGIQPSTAGREIGGFRVDLIPGGANAAFDIPQNPNFDTVGGADPFPLKFGGFVSPTSIQYGGLSGGGGGLADGNTVQLRFSIDVPGSSNVSPPRNFTLRFTANPEPGSLMFAGVLGIAGFGYFRRRSIKTDAGTDSLS